MWEGQSLEQLCSYDVTKAAFSQNQAEPDKLHENDLEKKG